MSAAWRRRRRAFAASSVAAAACALAVLDRAFPPDLSRLHTTGTEVLDRNGRTLSVLPAPGGVWRLGTRVEDVPPHLVALLVAAEDRRFRFHPGVDPLALARAGAQWARHGRVVSGGSTLTMQAARLLEPRPRTLRSKLAEAFRALQLETLFSKDEILGIWLTLAPQGGNVEGLRAGSLAWFGRPAARLDPAEAALLVAIPRRPEALRPDRDPDRALAARNAVLGRRAAGAVGAEDAALALRSPVPAARLPMPRSAPHLSRELARGDGGVARVPTTLDLPLQRAVEGIGAAALRELPERASVAVVVAELRTREARALHGGAFGAEGRGGALDLTRAVRSPGSALKPALYALAFEAGLAGPEATLADLPRRFGAYAPENYGRDFAGRVSVAESLRQSLNTPAVALLAEVGPLRFAAALKAAGAPPRLPPGAEPALPLALGGAGTTLREMAALYAALGDSGWAGALRFSPGPPQGAGAPVFDRRAAAQVADILAQPFPGGGPAGVAWKTGTSWGGRDAWAFGFDERHVVGIWVGRPDGTPLVAGADGATGARAALPILARVFERLPPAPREAAPPVRASSASSFPAAEAVDRLRLVFPPSGAVLEAGPATGPVTLRASGGRRPLSFLVDGRRVEAEPARREAAWTPAGPGFYRVTVLDAEGEAAAAAAEVRVR